MRFAPRNNEGISMRGRDRSRALCSEHKGPASSQYARRNNPSPRTRSRVCTYAFCSGGQRVGRAPSGFASDVTPAQETFAYYGRVPGREKRPTVPHYSTPKTDKSDMDCILASSKIANQFLVHKIFRGFESWRICLKSRCIEGHS